MKYLFTTFFTVLIMSLHAQTTAEEKIKSMGLQLPPVTTPIANYVKFVKTGNLIFLSGHGPTKADGTNMMGKVGTDLTEEQGYEAAKLTALNLIATLRDALGGSLLKLKRIVKVNGYVNCGSKFKDHPKIINGCSDLLVAVFGENGKHARAAMGMNSLPNNIAVEIEMIVEVED
jgi:enamine deaminase RidA (YjgF/YER057c/UK114 family)